MRNLLSALTFLIWAILNLPGCAEYRAGYYSQPHFTGSKINTKTKTSGVYTSWAKWLNYPDCKLFLSPNNAIQESNYGYFLVVPFAVSSSEPFYDPHTAAFKIWVTVHPDTKGLDMVLDKIKLVVNGVEQRYIGAQVSQDEGGAPYYPSMLLGLPPVETNRLQLSYDKWNHFAFYFKGNVPDVNQNIYLDLSKAIISLRGHEILPIKFNKVGY